MKRPRNTRICEVCGLSFVPVNSGQYCGDACSREGQSRKIRSKRYEREGKPRHPNPTPEEIMAMCKEIRDNWTPAERRAKNCYHQDPLVIGDDRLATYEGRMGLDEPEDKEGEE